MLPSELRVLKNGTKPTAKGSCKVVVGAKMLERLFQGASRLQMDRKKKDTEKIPPPGPASYLNWIISMLWFDRVQRNTTIPCLWLWSKWVQGYNWEWQKIAFLYFLNAIYKFYTSMYTPWIFDGVIKQKALEILTALIRCLYFDINKCADVF